MRQLAHGGVWGVEWAVSGCQTAKAATWAAEAAAGVVGLTRLQLTMQPGHGQINPCSGYLCVACYVCQSRQRQPSHCGVPIVC